MNKAGEPKLQNSLVYINYKAEKTGHIRQMVRYNLRMLAARPGYCKGNYTHLGCLEMSEIRLQAFDVRSQLFGFLK